MTRLRLGRSRGPISAGARNLALLQDAQNGSGAHPASHSMATGGSFPEVKLQRREVDHQPPSSAAVQNEWSYNYAPPIHLHGVDRDKFTS